jgi:transposase
MSIREISRRTGLARNTVKKHLRSDETEPSYEGRVSSSKLDPYAEKLATWLGIEAKKIADTAAHLEADPHKIGERGFYKRGSVLPFQEPSSMVRLEQVLGPEDCPPHIDKISIH